MALSNIFNEPRREITESAIGIVTVLAFVLVGSVLLYGCYRLAESFCTWRWPGAAPAHPGCGTDDVVFVMIVGILSVIVAGLLISVFFLITHRIGEILCDILAANHGIELRPRWRR